MDDVSKKTCAKRAGTLILKIQNLAHCAIFHALWVEFGIAVTIFNVAQKRVTSPSPVGGGYMLKCMSFIIAVVGLPLSVFGGTVNLSTGLDFAGSLITASNGADAHWTVDQPAGGTAAARVVVPGSPAGAFPIWAADGPNSAWITIDANSKGNAPVVPYTYYRFFNLSAADVASASLSGLWGIDDGGEVRLNGFLLASSPSDYSATTTVSAASGSGYFVSGLNTLTITMTISDNVFEGVRFEGSVTSASNPEPASCFLLFGGLGLLLMHRRRAT